MGQPDCYFSSLALELESKRDRMAAMLRQIGMTPVVPEGGYFMIVDVTALSKWVEGLKSCMLIRLYLQWQRGHWLWVV